MLLYQEKDIKNVNNDKENRHQLFSFCDLLIFILIAKDAFKRSTGKGQHMLVMFRTMSGHKRNVKYTQGWTVINCILFHSSTLLERERSFGNLKLITYQNEHFHFKSLLKFTVILQLPVCV